MSIYRLTEYNFEVSETTSKQIHYKTQLFAEMKSVTTMTQIEIKSLSFITLNI